MQIINETTFNELHEKIPMRLVIIHNLIINEYVYILLNEEESVDIKPDDIRIFVREHYVSNFEREDFTITFYSKTTNHA